MGPQKQSRMLDFLALVLDGRLEAADISRRQSVVPLLSISAAALSRQLNGESPSRVDEIVTAYADALGCSAHELWAEALAEWKRDPEGVSPPIRRAQIQRARKAKQGALNGSLSRKPKQSVPRSR